MAVVVKSNNNDNSGLSRHRLNSNTIQSWLWLSVSSLISSRVTLGSGTLLFLPSRGGKRGPRRFGNLPEVTQHAANPGSLPHTPAQPPGRSFLNFDFLALF